MSVRFYEFGRLVGGSTPGGGSVIPAEASFGPPEQFEGTLGVGITTIAFAEDTKKVSIRNTHDLQNLDYSLDEGATWFTLQPYQVEEEPAALATIQLQPTVVGQTPTYQIIGILQA